MKNSTYYVYPNNPRIVKFDVCTVWINWDESIGGCLTEWEKSTCNLLRFETWQKVFDCIVYNYPELSDRMFTSD